MNKNIVQGRIMSLATDIVTITFSCSIISNSESSKRMFKKSNILFRDQPAPISLITIDAQVECTLDERSNIIKVNIPSKLEIYATFGTVNDIDKRKGTATVFNLIDGYEIYTNQLLYNNTAISHYELDRYLHCPVYIFINGDAFLEAKLIDQNICFVFELDAFKRNLRGEEITTYTYMRDNRLISHYLPTENVFYKDTQIQIPTSRIKEWLGKKIVVRFLNDRFIGEIDEKPEIETYVQEVAPEIQFSTYSSRNSKKEDKTSNNFHTVASSKEKSDHQEASIEVARKMEAQQEILCIQPEHTVRIHLGVLYEINWFYYQDNIFGLNPSSIILVGILELCYRFPKSKVCITLQSKLNALLQQIGQQYSEAFNYLITIGHDKSYLGHIERFYKAINEYNQLISYIAQIIIPQPENYLNIAEEFSICINLYTYLNSQLSNYPYIPFNKSQSYPVINLYYADKLYILYSEEIMKYDGFDLTNWTLVKPYYFEEVWPLMFTEPEVHPNYINLFESCKKIVESPDPYNRQAISELIEALKSLKSQIPDHDMPRIIEVIKDMSRVRDSGY